MRRKCLFLKLDSVPESSSLKCCASCGKCSGGVSGFPGPTVDSNSLQVLSCIAISTEQAKQGLKSQIVSKIYFDKTVFVHFGLEELSPFFFHRISSYLITVCSEKFVASYQSGRSCHVPNVARLGSLVFGSPKRLQQSALPSEIWVPDISAPTIGSIQDLKGRFTVVLLRSCFKNGMSPRLLLPFKYSHLEPLPWLWQEGQK